MNKYVVINTLCYEIIEESTPVKAWAEFTTKKIDITKDLIFWSREDLRQYLIKNNYKTLTPTSFKNVFIIK